MMQKNVRIRDALKTEYSDFADFCMSLDKQFVSELTTSDFIAFRTQHGTTRDYIARIQHTLDSFVPDAEAHIEVAQADLPFEDPSAVELIEKASSFTTRRMPQEISEETQLEEPDIITEKDQEPVIPVEDSLAADKTSESISDVNVPDEQPIVGTVSASKKLFSSGKAWFNYLEELSSVDVEVPIYDLLGIPHDPILASRDITELDLSVRPYNCLMNNNCKTLDSLFSKSLREISEFSNLGKKSLFEIIGKCKEFATNPRSIINSASAEAVPQSISDVKVNEKLVSIAEAIALGIEYDTSNMSDSEKNYIALLEDAYQVLGEDLCIMALEEPEKASNLCSILKEYIERQEALKQVALIVNHISTHGISMSLHVLPFVSAIKKKTGFDLTTIFTENDRFADISLIIKKYINDKHEENVALIESIQTFADEIATGISGHLAKAYENAITTDRAPVVIQLRQEGYTLAEVGDLLSITRERVRQIESKAIRRFSASLKHAGKDVIYFIHALLDGDMMIHKEEVATCVSDSNQLNLLWACIENGDFDGKIYSYIKQYKAVVFKHENADAADKIVDKLPPYIFQDEIEDVIKHAVEEQGVWEEKIRADIKQRYKLFGTLYSERRPTVIFICDWILKNRFANGYKINDEIDAKRFMGYVREVFGEESSHMTSRALDAKVSQVGVLCDRGKYIHPSMVSIDEGILDEIDQYIVESPKNAITYIELFEAFKEKLAGTQISNHYFLQGAMKQYGSTVKRRLSYYLYRDYITKDEGVSPTDELDAFVRERGVVHKSEIFAEFPALNEVTIGQVVARCPNVFNVDGGNYIHASQFHILDADYVWIRAYLTEVTHELPVNIRKVFDDCSIQFPQFMDRNDIHNRDILYAVLSYMFKNEFKFNRPYIANSDDVELTNRGVILGILESYDEIAIDELMDMLDERSIHYVSLPNLLQLIAPDYIRTDENLLMKRALTGIEDDVEEEALSILTDAIDVNGYLPSCKVQDFIWYPSIDVTWTPYLLESIVLSSDKLDYVPYPFSRSHRSLVVYVSKKYANCDFQSMLLKIISEEYDKGTFARKSDMREWLIEAGFVDVKLPNFLESAQYYYMSDDGRLVRREEAAQ